MANERGRVGRSQSEIPSLASLLPPLPSPEHGRTFFSLSCMATSPSPPEHDHTNPTFLRMFRMAISDSRSAIVTGLASVLVSTSNGVLPFGMQGISGA